MVLNMTVPIYSPIRSEWEPSFLKNFFNINIIRLLNVTQSNQCCSFKFNVPNG